ncbi:MAG: hypothetical protein ACYC49_00180 [Ignavibacteriaceae bacterium]
MCEFISWKAVERNGETHLFYLTDQEVFSKEGTKKFKDCQDNDVLGHGAIDRFFELNGKGRQYEVQDFWNLKKLPQEIASKVQHFDAHWGKMFNSGAFQSDDLEYIVQNGPQEWRERAQKQLLAQKFTLLKSMFITVPEGYVHEKQLSTLRSKDFYYFNNAITDRNFKNVTDKLVSGKQYMVKFIGIGDRVTSEECLGVYKQEQALFVGTQGLSLLWQLNRDAFPVGKWSVSFDEKDNLWKDADGFHGVPGVDRSSDGGDRFSLGYFERGWRDDDVLVVFRDC